MRLEQAYPELSFRWRSRNWWARLARLPAECVHLERGGPWMATLIPDTLYLRGKASHRRRPARPEVSLCLSCLRAATGKRTLALSGPGRSPLNPMAPNSRNIFSSARAEFSAAGLQPEVAAAIGRRLEQPLGRCEYGEGESCDRSCDRAATWLWISRDEVPSLDDVPRIAMARAQALCSVHGPQKLLESFARTSEANLFYVNVPYGESGAYLWI